jgi:hypothetical protein
MTTDSNHLAPEGAHGREAMGGRIDRGTPSGVFISLKGGAAMAIRKRSSSWQIDYLDPGGRRVRQSFKTRKEAAAELGKRVSLIAEGRYLDVKQECKTTLAELCQRYEENFGHQSSWGNKNRYLENFKEYFGVATLLDNIRYVHLESYRNHLKAKPVVTVREGGVDVPRGFRKDASINREIACLHHLFRKAVEWQLMERSPFERGRSLILKENNKRLRFLSEDEIQRLLSVCLPHLRPVVECAVLTGMWRGEILSLKWEQVRGGFIYLQKTKTNEARQICYRRSRTMSKSPVLGMPVGPMRAPRHIAGA